MKDVKGDEEFEVVRKVDKEAVVEKVEYNEKSI